RWDNTDTVSQARTRRALGHGQALALSWPIIVLLSESQLPERVRKPRSNVVRVETAGIGQHPHPGPANDLVLRAHRRVAAAERRGARGAPRRREPPGRARGDLRLQGAGARQELLGTELVRPGGGTSDDVGDAEPEAEQPLLLIRPEDALGEARAVQGRPE